MTGLRLPDDRKSFKIGLAVQTQYQRVTDSQPSFVSKDRDYALRRAGKKSGVAAAFRTVGSTRNFILNSAMK